jgi:hypothetical protein
MRESVVAAGSHIKALRPVDLQKTIGASPSLSPTDDSSSNSPRKVAEKTVFHGLPLILQEQNTTEEGNIMDYNYLKCPHIGCGRTRKPKDAAQLASFLQRNTGEGLIS